MFESSGVFDEEEVKELYEKAVAYKKASNEWNGVLKAYRQKLEAKMVNIPENC
jgi:hypothetical protein